MIFYASHLPTCDICNKPATVQILGHANERYGYACARHAKTKIAQLNEAHNKPITMSAGASERDDK